MKKTVMTTSLALGLGLTGVAFSHSADASEINKADLADKAINHPELLNQAPVEEGAYDYSFVYNGYQFDFESNGSYWTWEYHYTGAADTNAPVGNTTAATAYQAPQAVSYQAPVSQPVVKQTYSAPQAVKTSYTSANTQTSGIRLANGNTAGSVGSAAAQEMARRTGVSASTWEHIIARESNGQVNAYNPSGASGLFQTMPGWGSTATVQDQINAATRAYNAQGLSAWGF
ncbi:transglycosylase SLT domain-containing protein [Macrococcus sp. DPC7161]|uniref:transglycosylase SLT domain-containing protein n=1 Tax=Macrococcus sp. DPC7161 TaxID=2507060 RepID=UPI00100A8F95|nr:transglycosylase SLT domain-containing protein [Macrococcus sp. DPC7161]RXK17463.1 transglycosylase [Macrococcus sp. DPC7161]